jgi:hypothetical protein
MLIVSQDILIFKKLHEMTMNDVLYMTLQHTEVNEIKAQTLIIANIRMCCYIYSVTVT